MRMQNRSDENGANGATLTTPERPLTLSYPAPTEPSAGSVDAAHRAALILTLADLADELTDEGVDEHTATLLGEAVCGLLDRVEEDRRAGLIRLRVETGSRA